MSSLSDMGKLGGKKLPTNKQLLVLQDALTLGYIYKGCFKHRFFTMFNSVLKDVLCLYILVQCYPFLFTRFSCSGLMC